MCCLKGRQLFLRRVCGVELIEGLLARRARIAVHDDVVAQDAERIDGTERATGEGREGLGAVTVRPGVSGPVGSASVVRAGGTGRAPRGGLVPRCFSHVPSEARLLLIRIETGAARTHAVSMLGK